MSLFKKNKNGSKVENSYCSLDLLQQTMMISSADHYDHSVVCQAQALQIVSQRKSGPLQPLWGAGGPTHPPHPPPYGPELYIAASLSVSLEIGCKPLWLCPSAGGGLK